MFVVVKTLNVRDTLAIHPSCPWRRAGLRADARTAGNSKLPQSRQILIAKIF